MLVLTGTVAAGAAGRVAAPAVPPSLVKRVAVFGTDEREAVPQRYAKLGESIGLFFSNQARTVCTAFCVAPSIIATAAHCLAQPGGKPAPLDQFMFARGYDRLREFARIEGHANGSTAQSVMSGDFRHRVRPPIDAANDWALVRLNRPACSANGLKVTPTPVEEIMAQAKAGRVFQLSYHRDWTQWRLAYSRPCHVAREFNGARWPSIAPDFLSADQMILHHCDTGGASSGSPMLLEGRDGVTVVGINVGTYVQSKVISDRGQVTAREKAETVANTAVSAAVFAGHIQYLKAATILASGQPIRDLQERLFARRFYVARIDGTYGPMLRAAIEGFERASRLPVTGLATVELLRRLDDPVSGGLGRIAPSSAPPGPTPGKP
jgi:protease YdgD